MAKAKPEEVKVEKREPVEVKFDNSLLGIKFNSETKEYQLVSVEFENATDKIGDSVTVIQKSPHIGIIVEAFKMELTKVVFQKIGIGR